MINLFLVLLFTITIFLGWYIYKLLIRYSELVSLLDDIRYKIYIFSKHITQVYELETYYGDETLQNLIEHSNLLLSSFEQFDEDYIVFDGEKEQNELQAKAQDEEGS